MKKFLAMLLALAMCLALVACGGSTTTEPQAAEQPEVEAGPYDALDPVELVGADSTGKGAAGQIFGEYVASRVAEITGGKLTIDYHPNGDLGGDGEVVKAKEWVAEAQGDARAGGFEDVAQVCQAARFGDHADGGFGFEVAAAADFADDVADFVLQEGVVAFDHAFVAGVALGGALGEALGEGSRLDGTGAEGDAAEADGVKLEAEGWKLVK